MITDRIGLHSVLLPLLIAAMTRRLGTESIDPLGIVANRLIPLDKGEGAVRPIGVGKVI